MAKLRQKQSTKYLCVDTNIFIQCCLLEIDGDDLGVLNNLHKLLNEGKVKLLLPEVIRLEFYRVLDEKINSLVNQIGKHKGNINSDSFDKKIKKDLIIKLDEYTEQKKQVAEKVKKEVESIFSHANTIQKGLEITPDVLVGGYKMFLKGVKPLKQSVPEKREMVFQQDCMIIESLKEFLKDKPSYKFYFCSQNKSDFSKNSSRGKIEIHKDISEHFAHIKYYENLGEFLNKEMKTKLSRETIDKLKDILLVSNFAGNEPVDEDSLERVLLKQPLIGSGEQSADNNPGEPT